MCDGLPPALEARAEAKLPLQAVTSIHPFPDANGRVAYDFAHHLLMQRWGQGPLAFPEAGHAALGPVLAPLDPPSAGRTVGDFVAATGALVRRLEA